jgi:hypothetical protein
METGRDSHLAFHNTDVCGRLNGSLDHEVYCKPNNRLSSPPQCPLPQIFVSDGACMMSWHVSSPF